MTAPEIGSRGQYGARYGQEILTAVNLMAWERLYRRGILFSAPPLRGGGSGLAENSPKDKAKLAPKAPLEVYGTDWKLNGANALKAADEVAGVVREIMGLEKKWGPKADRRVLATTDAAIVHYKLLVESFKQLSAFCKEMERVVSLGTPEAPDGIASNALDAYIGSKVEGYTYGNVYLCHGGEALKGVRFLGDLKELHATLDLADRMIDKHRGTPWETLIRRAYVPVFYLAVLGEGGEFERPGATSSGTETATPVTPARPERPSKAGTGGSSATSTGP
jgi:hypothetical protein